MSEEKQIPKAEKKPEPKVEAKKKPETKEKIVAVLVRGKVRVPQKIVDTLFMLKLRRKNSCVVLNKTESIMGMVEKVKDYITWGEASDEVLKALSEKEGKGYYNLNSPKKGFGRKGIKASFKVGGALGYRGDKINDLIKRML